MDPIMAIAHKHGLGVVSDAAQAAGAEYKGHKAGAIEDAAGFSLNPVKNLPGIEGGLFVANRPEVFENGSMVSQNIHLVGIQREYPVYSLGYNYRPNEMSSAFARAQLAHLDERNARRRAHCERLSQRLRQLPGVYPPHVPADRTHVYHIYRLRLDPHEAGVDLPAAEFRDRVRQALAAEGVPCSQWIDAQAGPLYPLLQLQEGFGKGWPWALHPTKPEYRIEAFPEAKRFLETTVELSRVALARSPEAIDRIADAFTRVWEHLDEVVALEG
jgi:dTDP-4-amino-4,6-dideoxygalactose transaminase